MNLQHTTTSPPCSNHRSRGTAEIELILTIPILLAIVYLTGILWGLGPARIGNALKSQNDAYRDATVIDTPPDAQPSDIRLDDSTADLEQSNDVDQVTAQRPVPLSRGNINLRPITLTDKAQFASPAWAENGYPQSSQNPAPAWVGNYASQSTDNYRDPLELAPFWTP